MEIAQCRSKPLCMVESVYVLHVAIYKQIVAYLSFHNASVMLRLSTFSLFAKDLDFLDYS